MDNCMTVTGNLIAQLPGVRSTQISTAVLVSSSKAATTHIYRYWLIFLFPLVQVAILSWKGKLIFKREHLSSSYDPLLLSHISHVQLCVTP